MSKAIIYLRTSTSEQKPENQKKDCLSICKSEFGEPEIILEKQSAWKDKDRPKFENIREQIKQGQINHLIVWDLDRIHRNRKKLIEFFKFCKYYKCSIHSYRQQFLEKFNEIPEPFNEIMYDMMLQIMAWLSEEESRKKSERVKIAYQNHKGKWGRKGLPEKTINEVLKMYNKGHSLRDIADDIYYYDKNRNLKKISLGAVHKIIKNNAS